MTIISSLQEMQNTADSLRAQGKRIGVVPTMGYLHEGHLTLCRIAKNEADIVIMTIFVNPLQFGPGEDFSRYPRDIERDKALAETAGVDILFLPEHTEMYPPHFFTHVHVEQLTEFLEGKVRPGHFQGVTTVVAKLFNLTKPHTAIFGQKDAQQAIVIRKMVGNLNFDINIIIAPIVRELDGLAMSSRNVYLSKDERSQSTVLSRSLQLAEKLIASGNRDCGSIISSMTALIGQSPLARIDYVSIADTESLQELSILRAGDNALISLAVRFGTTRLIDNTIVHVS